MLFKRCLLTSQITSFPSFIRSISTYRFIDMVTTYNNLNGHACIPVKFVVPENSPDWRREDAGHQLGKYTSNWRNLYRKNKLMEETVKNLEAVNFAWRACDYRWKGVVLPALRIFKEIYGHLYVPNEFVIPKTDPWPKPLHNYALGVLVVSIRSRENYIKGRSDRKADLENIGFIFDHYEKKFNDIIFPAILRFKELNNHLRVSRNFKIPATNEWPKETHHLNLGEMVHNIRSRGDYIHADPSRKERLRELGFIFPSFDERFHHVILPAFQQYKEIYKDVNVPEDFIIPKTNEWTEELHSLPLGKILKEIKMNGNYISNTYRKKQLLKLGVLVEDKYKPRPELQLDDK